MNNEQTGKLIRRLRLEQNRTQKQVAEYLNVSEQAVSKWERGLGLPDISSLNRLSECLGVNLKDLLSGELIENEEGEGKLKNIHFYVCPVCENLIFSSAGADISCCGRTLSRLNPKQAEENDKMMVQEVEYDWYITSIHPMTKDDYIQFSAVIQNGKVEVFSHYPEWNYELRIPRRAKEQLYWYSGKKGLLYQDLQVYPQSQ